MIRIHFLALGAHHRLRLGVARVRARQWCVVRLAAALLLGSSNAVAQSTALLGATVIDGTGKPGVPNAVVVVTGDRLSCVGTVAQCPVPAGATRVDVTGR